MTQMFSEDEDAFADDEAALAVARVARAARESSKRRAAKGNISKNQQIGAARRAVSVSDTSGTDRCGPGACCCALSALQLSSARLAILDCITDIALCQLMLGPCSFRLSQVLDLLQRLPPQSAYARHRRRVAEKAVALLRIGRWVGLFWDLEGRANPSPGSLLRAGCEHCH